MKTDRNDARGIAQLVRLGWFKAVHVKAPDAQETRALLTARQFLVDKVTAIENTKLAVILHSMWKTNTPFRWSEAAAA